MTMHIYFDTAEYSVMTPKGLYTLQFFITNKSSFISTGLGPVHKYRFHSFVKGFISNKQCIPQNKLKKSLKLHVQLKSKSLTETHQHVISEYKRDRNLEKAIG